MSLTSCDGSRESISPVKSAIIRKKCPCCGYNAIKLNKVISEKKVREAWKKFMLHTKSIEPVENNNPLEDFEEELGLKGD
jgi:hypothetical protein